MKIYELVREMKLLERRLTLFEEKYGILSEDFYAALMSGKLPSTMSMMKPVPILAAGKERMRLGDDARKLTPIRLKRVIYLNRCAFSPPIKNGRQSSGIHGQL